MGRRVQSPRSNQEAVPRRPARVRLDEERAGRDSSEPDQRTGRPTGDIAAERTGDKVRIHRVGPASVEMGRAGWALLQRATSRSRSRWTQARYRGRRFVRELPGCSLALSQQAPVPIAALPIERSRHVPFGAVRLGTRVLPNQHVTSASQVARRRIDPDRRRSNLQMRVSSLAPSTQPC